MALGMYKSGWSHCSLYGVYILIDGDSEGE